MLNLEKLADCVNILGGFCGKRDISELSSNCLQEKYGIIQADVLILFGGSIPCGADVAAHAMKEKAARQFMIDGGEGHTTESLRQKLHAAVPNIGVSGRPEADIFSDYIYYRYGIRPDFIERESTNCGNNVTGALKIFSARGLEPKQLILIQDTTMQRRMDAGFRRHLGDSAVIINFPAYSAKVVVKDGRLAYENDAIWGMWEIEHYISLLMGEIPRLRDDENGYGPNGKGFIAHVDIPNEVEDAFALLEKEHVGLVRAANPRYATKAD